MRSIQLPLTSGARFSISLVQWFVYFAPIAIIQVSSKSVTTCARAESNQVNGAQLAHNAPATAPFREAIASIGSEQLAKANDIAPESTLFCARAQGQRRSRLDG